MPSKDIIILHEYGAKSHYLGLCHLAEKSELNVTFYEFSFLRQILKGLVRRDFNSFKRGIVNFGFLLRSFITGLRGRKVIIGIAPYDYRIILIKFILRNSGYYLHTSWPNWFGGYTPKRKLNILTNVWKSFVHNSRGVFAVTDAVKNNFCDGFEYPKNKCHVVYHAYNDAFAKVTTDFSVSPKSKKINIIYVGRYEESKGINEILTLAENNYDVDFHFVGFGSIQIPQKSNIVDHGKISDPKKLAAVMKESDILLLPSRKNRTWQEAFGMVIVEGLAVGLYPIVINQIGPSEIIGKSIGSIFSESEYVDKANVVINDFKSFDEAYLKSLKQQSVLFSTEYSVENISKKWIKILD